MGADGATVAHASDTRSLAEPLIGYGSRPVSRGSPSQNGIGLDLRVTAP
jgi:hypothetical protein